MIYVNIIDTQNLIGVDVIDAVRSLPFGENEKARLLSIKAEGRRLESLGALIALRDIMAKRADLTPTEIVRDGQGNGKPRFDDPALPHFSLAHSCKISAAAVSDAPVGIDVEVIRPHARKEELAARFFTSDEQKAFSQSGTDKDFLLIWTQKEALVKLHGASLADSLGAPLSEGKRVFSGIVSIGEQDAAVSVYSAVDDKVKINISSLGN